MRSIGKIGMLMLMLGGWVACASPPPRAAIAQAELAITEAESQGAGRDAALELRKASDLLDRARSLATAGETQKSQRAAEEAEIQARVAAAKARRAEAARAVDELEDSVGALQQEIDRNGS